jgi:cell division protein FtsQ
VSHVLERVHTDPRLRRRRKAVERSRRRKNFIRLSAIAAVLVVLWAVFWSPLLNVRHLEVKGTEHTSSQEILDVTALGSDTNILRVSTDEIGDRVETLPWVKRATVARVLPGTLRIKIDEREPALAMSIGADHWLVDATGRVLASGKADDLPVLAGTDVEGIKPGMDIKVDQLVGGLRVYRSLSGELRQRVAVVLAPTPERIALVLTDGSQVRYGSAELLEAKANVLESLLARLERDGMAAAYIDLRVPTSPAVSPVSTVPVTSATTSTGATSDAATAPTTTTTVDPNAEAAPTDPTAETVIPDGAEQTSEGDPAATETPPAD